MENLTKNDLLNVEGGSWIGDALYGIGVGIGYSLYAIYDSIDKFETETSVEGASRYGEW